MYTYLSGCYTKYGINSSSATKFDIFLENPFFLTNFFWLIISDLFSDLSQIVRFLKILTFQGQVSRGIHDAGLKVIFVTIKLATILYSTVYIQPNMIVWHPRLPLLACDLWFCCLMWKAWILVMTFFLNHLLHPFTLLTNGYPSR